MGKAGKRHFHVCATLRIDPRTGTLANHDIVGLKLFLSEDEAANEVKRLQHLYDHRMEKWGLTDRDAVYTYVSLRLNYKDATELCRKLAICEQE